MDEKQKELIANLKPENVISVYNGKEGRCCCGCAGKHFYNPAYKSLGGKKRGYAVDDDECDLKKVSWIVNKLKKVEFSELHFGPEYIAATVGKRYYIAYLKK